MGDPSDFTTDTNCCVKNATSENVYLTDMDRKVHFSRCAAN